MGENVKRICERGGGGEADTVQWGGDGNSGVEEVARIRTSPWEESSEDVS